MDAVTTCLLWRRLAVPGKSFWELMNVSGLYGRQLAIKDRACRLL
jgi:hypothetical protein